MTHWPFIILFHSISRRNDYNHLYKSKNQSIHCKLAEHECRHGCLEPSSAIQIFRNIIKQISSKSAWAGRILVTNEQEKEARIKNRSTMNFICLGNCPAGAPAIPQDSKRKSRSLWFHVYLNLLSFLCSVLLLFTIP